MPRDEDEDTSAPLDLGPVTSVPPPGHRSSAPDERKKPVTAAAEPGPDAPLRWGVCGAVHAAGELVAFPGTTGVIRFVKSGVGYSAPPAQPQWRSVPSEPGRYEIPWDGNPAVVRSMGTVRSELETVVRRGHLSDRDHPLLRDLDDVARSLTGLAERLHQARWSLGLIRPDNVLIRGTVGHREVVLVDLGFAWRGAFGAPPWDDSPGRPDWLDPQTPYRWLWTHEPTRQQFADPENGFFPPSDPGADIRSLGRLFAWLVSGHTGKDLPAVGGPGGPPPSWSVLADAAAGRIGTAAELAARLRGAPLSEYFAPLPLGDEDLPRGSARRWVIPVTTVALIAAAGGTVYLMKNTDRIDPAREQPANRNAPADGRTTQTKDLNTPQRDTEAYSAAVKDVEGAINANDPAKAFKALGRLFPATPPERRSEVEILRARALDKWIAAYNDGVAIGNDPVRRLEAAEQLTRLHADLKELIATQPATDPTQREKEQQCLDVASQRVHEFGWPQ